MSLIFFVNTLYYFRIIVLSTTDILHVIQLCLFFLVILNVILKYWYLNTDQTFAALKLRPSRKILRNQLEKAKLCNNINLSSQNIQLGRARAWPPPRLVLEVGDFNFKPVMPGKLMSPYFKVPSGGDFSFEVEVPPLQAYLSLGGSSWPDPAVLWGKSPHFRYCHDDDGYC